MTFAWMFAQLAIKFAINGVHGIVVSFFFSVVYSTHWVSPDKKESNQYQVLILSDCRPPVGNLLVLKRAENLFQPLRNVIGQKLNSSRLSPISTTKNTYLSNEIKTLLNSWLYIWWVKDSTGFSIVNYFVQRIKTFFSFVCNKMNENWTQYYR